MSLIPIFSLNLQHKVLPRMVAVGRFDGEHPCLACATRAGKVVLHEPHKSRSDSAGGRRGARQGDVSLLNVNQAISALCVGRLDPECSRDMLLVGTQNNLLAYDVENNADLFYKDTPDGVNACVVGPLGGISEPLAIVGGNCSLLGFDRKGEDRFWSVTGDNVCSLALMHFTGSPEQQLLVVSEDFDIRIFHEDEIIQEISETGAVTNLCDLQSNYFGYGLSNGTVGVYDRASRYWRIKSKNHPVALHSFDFDSDGVPEVVTGWSNGKVDVRDMRTGKVIFKHTFPSAIAGITQGDYRMNDQQLLMVASVDGEVKGWERVPPHLRSALLASTLTTAVPVAASVDSGNGFGSIVGGVYLNDGNPGGGSGSGGGDTGDESTHDLLLLKQNLLLELRNYEENAKVAQHNPASLNQSELGVIPANTQLQTSLSCCPTADKPCVQLLISTSNDTVIKAVVIFAEGVFEGGESFVVHPPLNQLASSLQVPIVPPKDVAVDLHIKAFIGTKTSTQFHVFELTRQLPRFSMYALLEDAVAAGAKIPEPPRGYVQFTLQERVQRVLMWVNVNFLVNEDLDTSNKKTNSMDVSFVSMRTSSLLKLTIDSQGLVTIMTDNMDLAGDVVTALAAYLGLDDLATTAEFPDMMEELKELLIKVDEYQAVRQRIVAEMADHSNLIKSLVVRGEDARLLGDMRSVKKCYSELYDLNRDLLTGYNIRSTNHEELLSCLKQVNQIIQRAGKLRVGVYKTQVVNLCRQAIKDNNINVLYKIIKTGSN